MLSAKSCIEGCVLDVEVPIRVSFLKLYQWPYSDAEFLKEIARRSKPADINSPACFSSSASSSNTKSQYHESFAYRQRYLRSYTFSTTKETTTIGQRRRKWLLKLHFLTVNKSDDEENNSNESQGKTATRTSSYSGMLLNLLLKYLFSCMSKLDVYEDAASSVNLPRPT